MLTTQGRLLGGRVIYSQPESGFRSGIEPILLAAATPARPGERVLEGGSGAGAALLCLHARVPDVGSVGIEIDEAMVGLAARNAAANGFAGMAVLAGSVESVDPGSDFDHAIANPPYHPVDGTASQVPAREVAKRGTPDLLAAWVVRLAGHLRVRGTLTLVVPAALVPACLTAMATAGCGGMVLFPLWPMAERPAKLVMVRGIRGSRATMRLLPGLVLHEDDGAFTAAAQAALRDSSALRLD